MQLSRTVNQTLPRCISTGTLAVLAFGFFFCATTPVVRAQGGYSVQDKFWYQEPLASIYNNNTNQNYTVKLPDDWRNNGSMTKGPSQPYIRMNGTTWGATIEKTRGTYDFTAVNNYKTQFGGYNSANFIYTWYRTPSWARSSDGSDLKAPDDLTQLKNCQAPLPSTPQQTDCSVKEFWTEFMINNCGSVGGNCWIKNFELWNEFNDSQYWTDSPTNLSIMQLDAYAIIKNYCPTCMVSLGSTSAGGAGTSIDTTDTPNFVDTNFPCYSGASGCHYASYDHAQDVMLSLWQSAGKRPDFISWHPYPDWQHVTYKNSAGVSYNTPSDPTPFPETACSGVCPTTVDTTDYGDGNPSDRANFHKGGVLCATTTNEYDVAWTDADGTQHYGACGDPIAGTGPSDTNSQIYKIRALATKYGITYVDPNGNTNPVIWATEGGYSQFYNMQGTDEGTSETSRDFLRRSYLGRYLINLAGRGVIVAIPYSYDNNGSNCYMAQFEPSVLQMQGPSGTTGFKCIVPQENTTPWYLSSDHSYGFVYNGYQTTIGENETVNKIVVYENATGFGPTGIYGVGGDGFDANYTDSSNHVSGALASEEHSAHGTYYGSGLTATGGAYNEVFTWLHGNQVYCENEDTDASGVYDCNVYNSSKTYIGTIFWSYKFGQNSPSFTPSTKGAAFTCKWYIDSPTPLSYTSGSITVSGEPVFYYADTVTGAPGTYGSCAP